MNTVSSIKERFKSILTSKTKEQRLRRDAYILMAAYLSEIERLYKDSGLNRKELAEKIEISPSYLSQVFKGYKPLNFITLAKMKNALGITFEVTAQLQVEKKTLAHSKMEVKHFAPYDSPIYQDEFSKNRWYTGATNLQYENSYDSLRRLKTI